MATIIGYVVLAATGHPSQAGDLVSGVIITIVISLMFIGFFT